MEILRTKRLTFQTWATSDIEEATAIWGDSQVMALLDRQGAWPRSKVEERLAREIAQQEAFGVQYWKVLEQETGALVGCCGLRPYVARESDLGNSGTHSCLLRGGTGYATEAAAGVVHYAFTTVRVPQLFAGHHPQNLASRRVLTKLGFQYIGDHRFEPTGLHQPQYELLNRDAVATATIVPASRPAVSDHS